VVSTLLERGAYRKYVERLRQRAGDSVIASLDVLADAGWEVFHHPSGGNFLWARVPHVEDSRDLAATAEKHGVTLAPGHYFRPNLEVSPWVRIN
ncbi:PLP-dependent aminotransferase family protein, partial [Escherichia coli]|nr:PLP-dependent aminotransferase family protein [Escherichia coli]